MIKKYGMRSIGLVVFIFIFTVSVCGKNKYYLFEQVSTEEGFAFDGITTIVEDQYGFVWFGGASGLYHYDAKQFKKHNSDPFNKDTPPSNRILKLYRDSFDRIWVCTENGLAYFDELNNRFVRVSLKDSTMNQQDAAFVSSIVQYEDTSYLVILNRELYAFTLNEQNLQKITIGDGKDDLTYLGRNEDNKIYIGTSSGKVFVNTTSIFQFNLIYNSGVGAIKTLSAINNHLWIAYNNKGIEEITEHGDLVSYYSVESEGKYHLPHNSIRTIIQRTNGDIWIGTYKGLVILGESENRVITHDPYNGLPNNSIYELYCGKNDGIWIGTWSGGLAYYRDFNYNFPYIRIIKDNVPISNSVIASFTEDSNGDILVGSETQGIFRFNLEKKTISSIENSNKSSELVKSIITDKYGTHWFGGFNEGLWQMKDDEIRMAVDGLNNYIISSLLADNSGIWIGTRAKGLLFYNTTTGTIENYRAEADNIGSISSDRIWDIYKDSKENIWICSDFGLSVKYKNEKDFRRFFHNKNSNSLSRNFNYAIAEDMHGKLWIGSAGAGIDIFDPETNSFSKFRLNDTIGDAYVFSIIPDKQGNMWFSCSQGIYVYYMKTSRLKKFADENDFSGIRFLPNSGFAHSSGNILFGGASGFVSIDPNVVQENPFEPRAYLSSLLIDNQPLNKGNTKDVNSVFPAGISNLELNYKQNSLSFNFTANNFINVKNNRFKYRMVNYLDDWIESKHGDNVSFTKIPPGNYYLQILASNNDGLWAKNPTEIQIKIFPPVWRTWYAYIIYILILAAIIFITVRNRQKIISERYRHAANEFLFAEKVRFFTNISHEFRTPLTLILSPLDHLMVKLINQPDLVNHLKMIKRNADRLLRLTNQLLDFRLIELNKVKFNPEKTEIIDLCKNVYDCFEYQITKKQINSILTSSFKSFYVSLDAEKIDKIIYNILSNALRYSPEKGQVILSIELKTLHNHTYDNVFYVGHKFIGESLEIKIKDKGKGIKPEILPYIFDRFFNDSDGERTGTGIGLHICQEYILLHNGNIMVTSEVDKGSAFLINIPVNNDIEFSKEPMIIQYHFDHLAENEEEIYVLSDRNNLNKVVLFAEDNDEHRIYLKQILSSKYKVLTAKNGQQAYEIAREVIPDLIISDVSMPGMSGIEFTQKIREKQSTQHIPIIILTAMSDEKTKMDCIQNGANDVLVKPVKEEYIFAKIEHIFKNIEILKQTYKGQNNEQISTGSGNESFIEKAEMIVVNNLQNTSLEIEKLSSMLNMSRSSFHRKLKKAVNLSPSEFVRDIRLKKAVELIKEGNLNMDEIGFIVGFNSQSYFIRSFKVKYGKTPTAFKAELSAEE